MKTLTRIIILPLFIFFLTVGNFPSLVYAATPTSSADCPEGQVFIPSSSEGEDGGVISAHCEAPPESGAFSKRTDTPTPIACTFGWSGGTDNINPVCWARAILAIIGEFFITIGTWVVSLAGGAFDYLLIHGIVEFGDTIKTIESSINKGWTALRDIANIVIIGLFVFIAVNMILGVQQFGEKKKIAQVLIVAILINFSLLFTKVIVDASNFTAYQFYNNVFSLTIHERDATSASSGTGVAGHDTSAAITGIGGRFLALAGVETLWDGYDLIRNVQESQDSALMGALYGMMMFVFLIATAFVLLYGAFLILSRAILIVFLMLTSALAFASWLIPQQYIVKGFSAWWESLLKAAFFAPILMALLWVVITVGEAIVGPGPHSGSLGKLAENAANEGNLQALFNFMLIIGLLFAAFASASAFSKTIAGFSSSASLAAAPFTLGNRFLAAPLLRQTLGRYQQGRALDLANQIEQAKKTAAVSGNYRPVASLLRKQGRAEARAGSDYNLFQGGVAKMVTAGLGIKGPFTGAREKAIGGFAAGAKSAADAAAKKASEAGITREEALSFHRDAVRERKADKQKELEKSHQEAEQRLKQQKEASAEQLRLLKEQHTAAQQDAASTENDALSRKEAIHGRHERGHIDTATRDEQLREEDTRIERAHAATQQLQNKIDSLHAPLAKQQRAFEETGDALTQFHKESNEEIQDAADKMLKKSAENVQNVAARLTSNPLTDYLPKGIRESLDNRAVARMARGGAKKKVRLKESAALRAQEREDLRSAGLLDDEEKKS